MHFHPNTLLNVISCFFSFPSRVYAFSIGASKLGRQNTRGEKWAKAQTGLLVAYRSERIAAPAEPYENSQLTTSVIGFKTCERSNLQ